MLELKVAQFFQKLPKEVATVFFFKIDTFKKAQKVAKYLAPRTLKIAQSDHTAGCQQMISPPVPT